MDDAEAGMTLADETLVFVAAVLDWVEGLPPGIDRVPFRAATTELRTAALNLRHSAFTVSQMEVAIDRLGERWHHFQAVADRAQGRVQQTATQVGVDLYTLTVLQAEAVALAALPKYPVAVGAALASQTMSAAGCGR